MASRTSSVVPLLLAATSARGTPAAEHWGQERLLPSDAGAYTGPKIFNLGLPRTGTSSLNACLVELGLRGLHSNHGQIEGWFPEPYDALVAGQDSGALGQALSANDAFGDLPWFTLAETLMRRYANESAVFVATRRPLAEWLPSFRHHVMRWVTPDPGSKSYAYFQRALGGDVITPTSHDDAMLADTADLDAKLEARFERHYADLERAAAAHRVELHVLELGQAATIPARLRALAGAGLAADAPASCEAYRHDRLRLLLSGAALAD